MSARVRKLPGAGASTSPETRPLAERAVAAVALNLEGKSNLKGKSKPKPRRASSKRAD